MKTEQELNEEINILTAQIRAGHPELSKYMAEMPVTALDEHHPEIALRNLQAYCNSLKTLIRKYTREQ